MNNQLKAVLVDDEKFARELLRAFLSPYPQIQIVGEAASLAKAVEVIETLHPEVVFLDIDLRGESGFSLFDRTEFRFQTVFVTAFDTFERRAFEINAFNFIPKPLEKKWFEEAMQRLLLPGFPPLAKGFLEYHDRVFVQIDRKSRFLDVAALKCIRATERCSVIWTTEQANACTNLLFDEWQERLPPPFFQRLNSSIIVNLEYVERVDRQSGSVWQLHLKDSGEPFEISPAQGAILLKQTK